MENYNITREQESVKKTFAGEKAKLAKMTFSEKIEYIFAYYKIHIIVILAVISIIGYSIYHAMTYTRYVLYIDILNSYEGNLDRDVEIGEYIGLDKHESVGLEYGIDTSADAAAGSLYKQIDIYTIADEIDVCFTDKEGADYVAGLGTTQLMETELPKELYELWEDKIVELSVYDTNTDDTFYDLPSAVDISGTKVAEYFGLSPETKYMIVCDLSGHEEYMQKFFMMLYDIETENY